MDLSGDNRLLLLGDYVRGGPDPYGVLAAIMALDGRWPIARDSCKDENADYGQGKVPALDGDICTVTTPPKSRSLSMRGLTRKWRILGGDGRRDPYRKKQKNMIKAVSFWAIRL